MNNLTIPYILYYNIFINFNRLIMTVYDKLNIKIDYIFSSKINIMLMCSSLMFSNKLRKENNEYQENNK